MQDMHALIKLRNINNPELLAHLYPDLAYALANRRNRFPVLRLFVPLYTVTFVNYAMPCCVRQPANHIQSIALEYDCSHDSPLSQIYQV